MASVNILSCCVCRDAFGIPENVYGHKVNTFRQWYSPIVQFELNNKPSRLMLKEDFDNIELPNFKKKCAMADYNKEVLQQFEDSDVFVLDLIPFLNDIVKVVEPDGNITYGAKTAIIKAIKEKGFFDNCEYSVIKYDTFDFELKERVIKKYCDWLINSLGYNPEQIILVKNYYVDVHEENGTYRIFENKDILKKKNEELQKLYDLFEKRINKCFTIEMPCGVYGDSKHIWGLLPLHYCKEYYDFLYQSISNIVDDTAQNNNELYRKFSKIISDKREKLLLTNFSIIDGKNILDSNDVENDPIELLADTGTVLYIDNSFTNKDVKCKKCNRVAERILDYGVIKTKANAERFVKLVDCVKGISGHNKHYGNGWITFNADTMVCMLENTIVLKHNGSKSKGQMTVGHIVDLSREKGNWFTFSVWVRVVQFNDNDQAGCIGIIDREEYYDGKVIRKKAIQNVNWERLSITFNRDSMNKVIVFIRANSGEKTNAIIEYASPKLEAGCIPTSNI